MGDETRTPPDTGQDDEERRRRVEVLSALAGGQAPATGSPPPSSRMRARPRPGGASQRRWGWPRVAAAVVILAAVIGGGLYWRLRPVTPATRALPDFVALTFGAPGGPIGCPARAAWSPDGRRVAVAGYAACGAGNLGIADLGSITGDALVVYDSTTGHVVTATSLDALIPQGLPASVRGSPHLLGQTTTQLQQLLWSPDGHQIALTFTTLHEVQPTPNTTALESGGGGLIVIPDAGQPGQPRVFPMPPPAGLVTSEPQGAPFAAARWDLAAVAMTPVRVHQALGFTWTTDDQLIAVPPLDGITPTDPVALGPVGNPAGGTHFSVWQSGQVGTGSECSQSSSGAPSTCCSYLSAAFGAGAAWSPDGRVVIVPPNLGAGLSLPLGAIGRLVNPPGVMGGAGSCAGASTPSGQPAVPLRDAALARVATAVAGRQNTNYAVAWRPDGVRLAAFQDGLITGDTPLVTVYHCRTGGVVARISGGQFLAHVPRTRGGVGGGIQLDQLAWSPDGGRLLVLSQGELTALLVGPRPLGG